MIVRMGEGRSLLMRLFGDVASRIADPHLRRAYELALLGAGRTAPNPAVGCVIVSAHGIVVGEGFHPAAGQPHAEVFALTEAGDAARGSTAYVTLEPCNHHGKTPPCSQALIDAGVARVVIGTSDPTVEAGGGAEALRSSGVAVEFVSDPSPFEQLNEGWIKRVRTGHPFVVAKAGISLDSCVALSPGRHSSMTGPHGAVVTAMLRDRVDAVLVGASTVTIDNPRLTVRGLPGERDSGHQPTRIVLVRSQMPPVDSTLFTDEAAPTILMVPEAALAQGWTDTVASTVRIVTYISAEGLPGVLKTLGGLGINEVLVEGGPALFSSLWRETGALDALVMVTAGGMAGGGGVRLYDAAGDGVEGVLAHRFVPVEAGIVGDVSVTMWRSSDSTAALP